MDGQQRLNSVVEFYEDGFALKGLERWVELNGLRFSELPETLRRGLDRRRLSATVLLIESTQKQLPQQREIRKLVFERLNTGGQNLNAQELRNCIYAGDFNNLLIELSQYPVFTDIWEIPRYRRNVDAHGNVNKTLRENARYKRMQDCELVLRFLAFRKRSNIKGSVRSMLDRCMESNLHPTAVQLAEFREVFKTRLDLAHDIFGDNVFRIEEEPGKWRLSHTLYDGIMVALDRLWIKRNQLLASSNDIVARVDARLKKPSAYEVIVGRPNTANAVLKRIKILEKAIEG